MTIRRQITAEHAGLTTVERDLQVTLGEAVTIPLKVDGQLRGGLVVYVGRSAFAPRWISEKALKGIALEIAMSIDASEIEVQE